MIATTAGGQSAYGAESQAVTVAVLRDSPPFSYLDAEGSWKGLAVEMWELVAADLKLETRYEGVDRSGLIEALATRRARFGIGPISITPARLERVDFSVPIFVTGLAIAVPHAPRSIWSILRDSLFSATFLKLSAGLLATLVAVGAILWLVERHDNPDFRGERIRGLGSGIWLSVVTMTTVGYGDTSPKTLAGRVAAAIWMFVSLVLVSIFTGTIATLLTLERLGPRVGGFDDLSRARVACVRASAGAQLLDERRVGAMQFPDLEHALEALLGSRADALVFDRALLAEVLKERPDLPVTILAGTLRPEYYAIAFGYDEPLRRQVNEVVARTLDSPTWSRLRFDYLGSHEEQH